MFFSGRVRFSKKNKKFQVLITFFSKCDIKNLFSPTQKIGAKIIQLNFQLMWTSGLTPLFIFFQLWVQIIFKPLKTLKNARYQLRTSEKKCIYPENLSSVSQIIKIKFQAKYKKIKIFLLAFLKFSLFVCFF